MSEPIEVHVETDYIILKCLHSSFTPETARMLASLVSVQLATQKKVIIDFLGCQDVGLPALSAFLDPVERSLDAISPWGLLILGSAQVIQDCQTLVLGSRVPCLASLDEAIHLIEVSKKIEFFMHKASDAVMSTFTAALGRAPETEAPYFRKLKTEIEIMAATKVSTHFFEGTLSIAFSNQTFLKIMSRMFGSDFSEITAEISDGAAELSNFVIGLVKSTLNDSSFDLKLGMPSSMREERVRLFLTKFPPTLIRPYSSDCGSFLLILSVSNAGVSPR